MRLFFALWPPIATAEILCAWARRLRRDTGGRLVPARNIHLTLAFLGEVEEGRVAELRGFPIWGERHKLPIECASYWARNSILWVAPEQVPAPLAVLVARLNDLLAARGYRSEQRRFAAHVTLLRKAHAPEAKPRVPDVDWPVEECVLVRSAPREQGARYEILQRYPLA